MGGTIDNPIDLSQGQSRAGVPQGAYYLDPQGNIRRNDNGDAGNPIFRPAGKQQKNAALKAKSQAAKTSGFKILGVEN